MRQCGDIVRDFGHIVEGNRGYFMIFEEQQVRQGRLCPFDLRRQQSLFPHIHVEKERRRREYGRDTVEASNRAAGTFVGRQKHSQIDGWTWRKRVWNVGLDPRAARRTLDKLAGETLWHAFYPLIATMHY